MSPQQSSAASLIRRLLLLVILGAVSLFLFKGIDILSRSRAQEPAANSKEIKETVLEDEIPRHVPIRIKIRKDKEAAFKDLKNETWARDFELEVMNIGEKPIYSLSLLLVTDLKAATGFRIVAPLDFGRVELGDIRVKAGSDDIAIKPGETFVFRIHPGQLKAWDTIQRKERRPHPKKIQIKFEALSFGDGTGYVGEDGQAIPNNPHKTSAQRKCVDRSHLGALHSGPPPNSSRTSSILNLPANFLPVNYLVPTSLASVSYAPIVVPQEDCCAGSNCTRLIRRSEHICLNCPNQNRITPTL